MAAGVALDAGALPLDAPIVDGLEEGADLVLLGESELGVVHPGEGERALVPGLEVGVRREEVGGAQIQVRSALRASAKPHPHQHPSSV